MSRTMRPVIGVISALTLMGTLTMCTQDPGSDQEFTSPPPEFADPLTPSVVISKMTGVHALTDTMEPWRIEGTDLGIFWNGNDDAILTAFGDTFGRWGQDGGGGQEWRSNVLLRTSSLDPSEGIHFDSAVEDESGAAAELIPSMKLSGTQMTTIPTAGIAVGDRQYMAFMDVREWGDPGRWTTNFSRIAYSDDLGETWNHEDGPTWENTDATDHPFQMVAFAQKDDNHVYMFGTPNGRAGTVSVARAASDSLLDKDAWEYWGGSEWSDDEFAVAPLFDNPASELSVIYNRDLDRWILITLQEADGLILRTAPEPTGPWSDWTLITEPVDHPTLYGGYIHPASAEGNDIYFALSEWRTYNVYLHRVTIDADGSVLRPNLVPDHNFEWQTDREIGEPWTTSGEVRHDDIYGAATHFSGITNARLESQGSEVAQPIPVEPGAEYQASVFISAHNDGAEGEFGVRSCDGSVLASTTTSTIGVYERLIVDFAVGECEWVEIYATSTSDDPVLVDAFGLTMRP